MQIRVGLENNNEGRSLAWVFDHPGCFAYGKDGTEAILRVPQALITYREWIGEKTNDSWLSDLQDFDIALTEVFECYKFMLGDRETEITAYFQDDSRPLSATEIKQASLLLTWTRDDLVLLISPLTLQKREQQFSGERWSINGVLRHVANANWWYLDRLQMAGIPRDQLSNHPVERLSQLHELMINSLSALKNRPEILEIDGETWSARKVLRRALWHIRDHHFHIERLMTLL
jgi:uncharacterized damage-inducible protein DinB